MKKKILAAIMAGLLTISFTGMAVAIDVPPSPENDEIVVSPRIEEVEWYYRIVDGKMQKRLWSITEGKWLTDWTFM